MQKDFKTFLEEKRNWYKQVGKVHCPVLDIEIHFNSKGFYHLRYDSHGKARPIKEQMYKIGLLPLVIPVIRSATAIYEYKKQEYSKPLGKHFEIWELRELVGKNDPTVVSVVLRRIGDGNITFLSVWKNKQRTKKPS